MRQERRKILARVFVALLIFLIGVVIYKQGNPYAYPGLENRILFVLVPSGIVLLYLYLEERETRNRLFSVIMVTIGRLQESKFMSFCEGIWERSPSLVHVRVSKVLAVLYTYLHKMSGYMLKQDPKEVVSHAFLGMLLIVALQSIFPQPSLEWARTPVMIAAVVLGVVTFYLNRDKLGEIEDEARQEKLKENLRMMEFDEKYPRVNGVWGVRRVQRVVRWMYKEGVWYSGGLILIVFVGFVLRIWNLGRLGLTFDEGIGWIVVDGIIDTGLPVLPGGNMYLRGLPYYYLNALIASIFGTSEFTLRIVSVLSGTGSIILFILIGKKAGVEKYLLLCGSAFLSFHYWTIMMSTWGRMYMFTVFFILLTLYIFLKLIEGKTSKNYLLFCISGSVSILSHNTGNVVFLYIISYFLVYFFRRHNIINVVVENIKLILSFIVLCSFKTLSTLIFRMGDIDTSTGSDTRTLLESLIRSLHLDIFKFNNYLFIQDQFGILIIPVLLTAVCVIALSKIWRVEKTLILNLSLLTFIITLFGVELQGGRIVFFQMFLYLISFLIIIQGVARERVARFLVLLTFLILLLPNTGFGVLLIDYGSKTVSQYSPSHVIDFYPDNKHPSIEVSRLAKENDTIIFYGLPVRSYPYLGDVLTYKNFYRISKRSLGRNTLERDIYTNTIIIYDYDNLVEIIDKSEGDVYLVTTFSVLSYSQQQPYLYHFRPYMLNNIIRRYQSELVFRSDDGVSSLYMISKTQLQKNQSELR